MKRSTVTLVVVLVVLAIATFIVLRQPGEQSSSGETGQRLVDYDSSAIDRIDIRSGFGPTVIEKVDGTWRLTEPVRYRADSNAVAMILNEGKRIELKNLVSSNPEKQSLFKVDSTGVLVRLSEKGSERAAFYIGKPSSTFNETFVRRADGKDVYLASGYLEATFSRQAKDLRDKMIFQAEVAGVKAVTFHFGDTTFTLALQDTVWRIGKEAANQSAVNSFLSSVTHLRADDFIDTAVAPKRLAVMIELLGTQIRFYGDAPVGKYYVQTSSTPQWFTCQSWTVQQVIKRKKDFLPS